MNMGRGFSLLVEVENFLYLLTNDFSLQKMRFMLVMADLTSKN